MSGYPSMEKRSLAVPRRVILSKSRASPEMNRRQFSDYTVFGLRVRSTFLLPELFRARGPGEPDVWIEEQEEDGLVSAEAGLTQIEGGLLLRVPEIGQFAITNGDRVRVQAKPGAARSNVRLFLLGSALGALLHQRKMLPLHGNAVEIEGRAFVFLGPSGAGKSTLAAWFHDQGHRILADDVSVVDTNQKGEAVVQPGLPRLRLWQDALVASGRTSEGLQRSYIGTAEKFEKFDVPLDSSSMVHSAMKLGGIYVLRKGDEVAFSRLSGIASAEALFAHTYRGSYVIAAGSQQSHWQSVMHLAARTPVFGATRPMDQRKFNRDAATLLAHARLLASGGASSSNMPAGH